MIGILESTLELSITSNIFFLFHSFIPQLYARLPDCPLVALVWRNLQQSFNVDDHHKPDGAVLHRATVRPVLAPPTSSALPIPAVLQLFYHLLVFWVTSLSTFSCHHPTTPSINRASVFRGIGQRSHSDDAWGILGKNSISGRVWHGCNN